MQTWKLEGLSRTFKGLAPQASQQNPKTEKGFSLKYHRQDVA